MQVLCQLSYSPGKPVDYSEGTLGAAKPRPRRRGEPAASVDVQVDTEQDQPPQEDGEQGRQDELDQPERDVVVGESHVDPDQDVDQDQQTVSAAEHRSTPLPLPPPEGWQRSLRRGVPNRQTNQSRMKRAGRRRRSGGDQAADLVAVGDHRGVPPQPLEVVVGPLLLQEHVDDEVHEVEEDPARLALAFTAQGAGPLLTAGAFDLFGDGADLAVAVAGADDEVVGDDERL